MKQEKERTGCMRREEQWSMMQHRGLIHPRASRMGPSQSSRVPHDSHSFPSFKPSSSSHSLFPPLPPHFSKTLSYMTRMSPQAHALSCEERATTGSTPKQQHPVPTPVVGGSQPEPLSRFAYPPPAHVSWPAYNTNHLLLSISSSICLAISGLFLSCNQ